MESSLLKRPIEKDLGLLIVRLGVGLSVLLFHGWGKITGGPELWTKLGGAMGNLGIHFLPVMWGFLAAFAESACSLFLVLGVVARPAAAILAFNMFVAMIHHLTLGSGEPAAGWNGASHALELFSVYVGLFLAGPGMFSLSRK
jgi:putative oxidoreductase